MEPQDDYAFSVWFRHHLPTLERLSERKDWPPEENLEDICRLAYAAGLQHGYATSKETQTSHAHGNGIKAATRDPGPQTRAYFSHLSDDALQQQAELFLGEDFRLSGIPRKRVIDLLVEKQKAAARRTPQ